LKCFEDWEKRRQKCIISGGDYFKGDKIDIDEKMFVFFNKQFLILFEQTPYGTKILIV
jgi:hypothetical protein